MTRFSSRTFRDAAAAKPPVKKRRNRPAPFSVRLSAEERERLETEAAGQPLGGYIREKLLGRGNLSKTRRQPRTDYALLAQILGILGKSDLASALCLLAAMAESGDLDLADDDQDAIQEACADVREIRVLLIQALGLKPPSASAKATGGQA